MCSPSTLDHVRTRPRSSWVPQTQILSHKYPDKEQFYEEDANPLSSLHSFTRLPRASYQYDGPRPLHRCLLLRDFTVATPSPTSAIAAMKASPAKGKSP